ncbi:MAG: WD40 repeat domain-containing protein [Cyanobacteria bacterium P01_D01_bin.56]
MLYLLTDENNTRPLKTREDIELEINVADKLDLVLTILVRSGLVFRIPSFPSDRYQLVHDYLVIFVRQTQSTQLIAELEKEREQRQLTERQLNEALQRQLRTARKATLALTGLITAVTGIALFSFLAFINIYILNQASSSNEDELNRIISTTQAGNSLNRFPGVLPEVRIGILSEMDSAMADARLLNLWSSHEDEITDVVFSSDSQLFATASRDKTVQLWSRDGSLLLDKPLRHETAVTSVNFSPDNQLIVTGDENGYVRVWSLDGQLIQKLDESHTSAITSLAFSPNGQKLASSAGDGVIKIWNASWQYQGTVANLETDISGISFSNNGKLLASFAEFDIVRIWNLETLKEVSTIEGTYRTLHVSFSEDDQYLNVVDRTARLKKFFLDGELITGDTFRTSGNFLNKVSLHPDERFYVAIGSNVTNLSNIATLGKLHVYNEPLQLEHKAGLVSIALSPDQTLMITSDVDNRSYLWYVEPFTKNGFSNNAPSLRFNFDEQYFVAQTGFQKFNISDYKDKSREDIELDGRFLSFSPSGQAMIVANNNTSVKIWEAQPNKIISIRDDNQIVDSVLSQDGNIIATGHKDGVIKIWGKDGILIREIKAHSREIEFLELTYNGRKIFSGDGESLKVWDLDGVLISELSGLKQADIFNKVILSPNSNEFITFEHQGIVKLWNSDGTLIRQLTEYSVPVRFAQFSSDGTRFLLKANGSFYSSPESKIFGKDGTLIEDLTNFEPIATTQFHPDGTELLVALSQSAYYGIRRISFDNRVLFPFEGHVGRINEIQFSSDNETIATASDDTTIILWKRHANDFKPLRGHTSGVVSLDFSSDDHALASLDNEGIVKLWDINGNELNSFEEYSDQYAERYGTSINFTSNENFLVLVDWDRTTFIDKNGSEIYSFTTFKPTQLSSNNDSILIPIQEPELKIIDMNGNVISTLKDQHTEHINSAVFSPNEDRIASASNDDTVVLWSRDGEPIKIIEHEDDVNSVAFSKDGKFLVTASDDKIIRIFDGYGNPILDAQGNKIELTEHTDAVTSVLFSPNGKHLASASTDGTMRLWDAKDWQQDGREIVTSSNTSGNEELDALWFSEDGNILAYGTNPTYIRLLNRRFRGGFFIKSATFHPVTEIPENGFPDNNGWLTVRGNRGIIALSLSVDHSLTRSCNWIVGHLQSNDNENDDNLCNGILGGR